MSDRTSCAVPAPLSDIFKLASQLSSQESELSLRAIFDQVAVGVAQTNLATGRFMRVNQRYCEIVGYNRGELERLSFPEITHPQDAGLDLENMARLRNGTVREFKREKRYFHKDGSVVWVSLAVSAVAATDGPPLSCITIAQDITERKQAELALQASEARNRTILQGVEAGVVVHGADSRITAFNAKALELLGVTEAQMAGRTAFDPVWRRVRLDGSPLTEEELPFRRAFATRRPVRDVVLGVNRPAAGDFVWLLVNAHPVLAAQGDVAEVIVTFMDVTARIRAEQTVRDNANFTEDVLNSLTAHVVVLDEWGTIIEVNDAWRRFGRENGSTADKNDFIGTNYLEVCEQAARIQGDALAAEAAGGLHSVLAGERDAFSLDYPCPTPAGPRWFKLRVSPLTGSRKGAVVAHQDITERKLAEEALRESEARFRQLAEGINQVFWLTDSASHQILYVSPAYERIWGRPCADLLLNPADWLESVHPDDRSRVAEAFAKAAGGGTYDQIYRIARPNGEERWVHDRAFPVRDDHGTIVRVAGLAEDITEQRRLESQFLRAQRLESIGTLASGIAHDLNNVLAPIMMSVQLLNQPIPADRREALLKTLEASAKRGAGMVKQVLMFARGAEGARVQLEPKHLLQEIERIIGETFPRTITIETNASADCSAVLGDVTQLQQVLLNLCVNSRDAMPAGGRLTISAANVTVDAHYAGMNPGAKPGPHVVLQVTDTGGGIPHNVIDKIFDPFFTTKEIGKGTGLGLSTVQAIVKSHGGFVHVYSEPKRGTTFKIYLPTGSPAAAEINPPVAVDLPRGHGELILIADDEESIRHVTKNTLETFGYRVLVAKDGAEAVALFAQHCDDVALVLTDMMMPVMDGPVAILSMSYIRPGVRVIATSGLSSMRDIASGVPETVKHHLQKPYTADKLLQTVQLVLQS